MNGTTPPTILIIDDEKTVAEVLSDALTQAGFKTLIAHDGQEGLTTAIEQHPNLILLDILMPKMDGMAVLQKLREDAWGHDAQVIFLTNISDFEKFNQAIEGGVHEYMVKSDWKLEEIVERVRKKLNS